MGSIDTSFNANLNAALTSLKFRSDGCLFLAGQFQTINGGTSRRYAAVTTVTGLNDPTFDANMNAQIYDSVLLPDGRAIVAGSFTTGGANINVSRIALISSTGLIDQTYTGGASTTVYSLALQPDGKLIVGGNFASAGGLQRAKIARLKANGFTDPTFTGHVIGGGGAQVLKVSLQPDGKVLIGGTFTGYQA